MEIPLYNGSKWRLIKWSSLAIRCCWKFSYGWPEISDLRKLITKYYDLKGECKIGLLSNRHVLIRATLLEDYVNLLSKPVFYITHHSKSFQMRTLKWDRLFNPVEETATTIAWISFPSLSPNFFGEEAIFSLASAVGKPLQVDAATKNQTRPSYVRVKVEVNLLKDFPKRIKICIRKDGTNVMEKWIKIKYDYIPKYCMTCMLQGHDEDNCYVKHPELFKDKKEEALDDKEEPKSKGKDEKQIETTKEGHDFEKQRRKGTRKKQHDKPVGVITKNKFNTLDTEGTTASSTKNPEKIVKENLQPNKEGAIASLTKQSDKIVKENQQSTKEWVARTLTGQIVLAEGGDKDNQVKQGVEKHPTPQISTNSGTDKAIREDTAIEDHEDDEDVVESDLNNQQELGDLSEGGEDRKEEEWAKRSEDGSPGDGVEYNIQQVSGDLSPRHADSLKVGKGKARMPLQVQTRSIRGRGRATSCDQ